MVTCYRLLFYCFELEGVVGRVRTQKWVGGRRRSKITYELKGTIRQTWIEGATWQRDIGSKRSLVAFYQDSYPRKNVAIMLHWMARSHDDRRIDQNLDCLGIQSTEQS